MFFIQHQLDHNMLQIAGNDLLMAEEFNMPKPLKTLDFRVEKEDVIFNPWFEPFCTMAKRSNQLPSTYERCTNISIVTYNRYSKKSTYASDYLSIYMNVKC